LLPSFLSISSNEGHLKKKLKPTPTSTSKCYCNCHNLEVSKLKKRRHHSTFSYTLCLLLSHVAHSDEDLNDQDKMMNKDFIPIDNRGCPSCLSPFSLFLLSSNLETRFLLRGVGLSHPEISNFRMWIERIIKQQFSHNFKTFPTFIFLYKKYSIGKSLVWFSESNKRLWVLHSCWCILMLLECKWFQKCV
jgi:hypothetical protein